MSYPPQGNMTKADFEKHEAAVTGIHGVGVSEIDSIAARLAAISEHGLLATGIHGVGASSICSILEVPEWVQRSKGIFWWNNNWTPDGIIAKSTGGTGSVSWYDWQVWLVTGGTQDSYAHIEKLVEGPLPTTWEKKRYFRADVLFVKKTTQNLHVGTGKYPNQGSGNTENHVGFVIQGDQIYGTVANGSTESFILLETLGANGLAKILEVIFIPGVEARFYIDGVDKGVRTANLPSGTTRAKILFGATANNLSNFTKQLWITQVRVYQEG